MSEPTEVRPDPDAAEEFAEEVGVDPTQEEIDRYRELEGEPPAAEPVTPDAELPDVGLPNQGSPDAQLADPAVS